eukprot:5328491-Alexandrium_andersonii.AAC.1
MLHLRVPDRLLRPRHRQRSTPPRNPRRPRSAGPTQTILHPTAVGYRRRSTGRTTSGRHRRARAKVRRRERASRRTRAKRT